MRSLLLLGSAAFCSAEVFFKETFDSSYADRWTQGAKDGLGKFVRSAGSFYGDEEINQGLKTSEDAKFYAISTKFEKAFDNQGKPLVVSFSVKHEQGIDCGGGYIKIFPELKNNDFNGDSEYFIMFGPDICGATKKIHTIFNYKGENLLWEKTPTAESDKHTHVYTLIVNPDNTYKVEVDEKLVESGKLEDDWKFLKPKEINDPNDVKPADWVDESEIDDPEDVKPDDWDKEPKEIADETAEKPEDWDDEDDGEWEAPLIPNPAYKGEWKVKRIPNPAYKGPFVPKKIANPDYVADEELYLARKPLVGVGIDIWQVKSGTIFDNLIISDSVEEVKAFIGETYGKTIEGEKAAKEAIDAKEKAKLEEESKKSEDSEDEAES